MGDMTKYNLYIYEKVVHSDKHGASVHATKLSDVNDLRLVISGTHAVEGEK